VGIDRRVTNRALRSLELFGGPAPIDRERFFAYKYDRTYAKDSPLYREAVTEVLAGHRPKDAAERRGLDILRRWDGRAEAASRDAALAVLTMRPIAAARELGRGEDPGGSAAFSAAVAFLERRYGRLDVPLGEVQRLRRGRLDLPLAGGPDALNAVYGRLENGALVGETGDSFFMLVEFHPDGRVESFSVQPYGASGRAESAHFNDQSLDFAERRLHKEPSTPEELRAGAWREYHPGEEP
jgi:acyl-homoserine lactone acylase PvdQ